MTAQDPLNMVADAVKNTVLGGNGEPPSPSAPKPVSKPSFKVSKGKKSFRKLFNMPDSKRDHNVTVHKATDWSDNIKEMIPVIQGDYEWQPEVEPFHVAMEVNEPILLTGPTGCGKSSMVEQYCAITCRPFVRMSMRGDIETSALLGMPQAKNGETYWVDGPVTQAVREGGVVLLDEYDFTPPEIMYSMQWLLEDNPRLLLADKSDELAEMMVTAHPDFRLIFAGNTKGQGDMTGEFPGAQVQSMATVDRAKTTLHMGYLTKEKECSIIKSHVKDITDDQLDSLFQLVGLLRTAYGQGHLSVGVSPRTEISMASKWMYWDNPKYAFELSFANKLEEAERNVALQHFDRVFGSKGV